MFLILWYLSFRITPACAGKSSGQRPASMLPWDHPRVCGEKYPGRVIFYFIEGSPPRVRGKEYIEKQCAAHGRITPACAGKRYGRTERTWNLQDHPRVCGEKEELYTGIFAEIGSPPRVRGKVVVPLSGAVPPRITPACAGKRRDAGWYRGTSQDHPRVCGEKRKRALAVL